jgi:hypothetical protein
MLHSIWYTLSRVPNVQNHMQNSCFLVSCPQEMWCLLIVITNDNISTSYPSSGGTRTFQKSYSPTFNQLPVRTPTYWREQEHLAIRIPLQFQRSNQLVTRRIGIHQEEQSESCSKILPFPNCPMVTPSQNSAWSKIQHAGCSCSKQCLGPTRCPVGHKLPRTYQ